MATSTIKYKGLKLVISPDGFIYDNFRQVFVNEKYLTSLEISNIKSLNFKTTNEVIRDFKNNDKIIPVIEASPKSFRNNSVVKNYKAVVPTLLNDEILEHIRDINNFKSLDELYAAISIISTKKLYNDNIDRATPYYNKKCMVEVSYLDFYNIIGKDYKKYLKALLDSSIIETDNHYIVEEKAKFYKIADRFFKDDIKRYSYREYSTLRIKSKIEKYKNQLRSRMISDEYSDICLDVETLFKSIDASLITDELLREFVEVSQMNDEFYYNCCDDFGGRFHSILTNTSSSLRKLINFNDIKYVNVDIKNSQFNMIALIIKYPTVAKDLLKDCIINVNNEDISLYDHFENVLNESAIVREYLYDFCDDALSGTLYENMSEFLGISRELAKSNAMQIFFSNNIQYRALKEKYSRLYPEFIELCNYMNDKTYKCNYMPMLAQRCESCLFLNKIVRRFRELKQYACATVHDSILIHPDDLELFDAIYAQVFEEFNVEPFFLKYESNLTVEEAETLGFDYLTLKLLNANKIDNEKRSFTIKCIVKKPQVAYYVSWSLRQKIKNVKKLLHTTNH